MALVATLGTGREVVTLSPHLGDIGLQKDIVELAPDVVVAEDEDWARDAVLVSARTVGAIALRTGATGPWRRSRSRGCRVRRCRTRDIAVLMMTSGTTGRPKRVELTYDRMTAAFRAAGWSSTTRTSRPAQPDRHLVGVPRHISGLYFGSRTRSRAAASPCSNSSRSAPGSELVSRHRPGYVRLAPTALRMVLQAEVPGGDVRQRPRGRFRHRAAAAGTGGGVRGAVRDPGPRTYGATEFAGAIAGWTLKDKKQWGPLKRGSVGRAHRGIELRFVDADTGDVLPAGQTGLLEARGGQLPGRKAPGCARPTSPPSTTTCSCSSAGGGRGDQPGGFKIPPSVIEDALARTRPSTRPRPSAAGRPARPGAGGGGDAAQPGHRRGAHGVP